MYTLSFHPDAKTDLETLWRTSEAAAALIAALIEEIQGDPRKLDALTDHDFGAKQTKRFHVSKWVRMWKQGLDLWRLKDWSLEALHLPYRIVYAYNPKTMSFHLLAVCHRTEIDYDDDKHPLTRRILNAYEDIRT